MSDPHAIATLRAALDQGASALGVPLEPAWVEGLVRYYALLERWRTRVRLLGRMEPRLVAWRHFLDSLTLLPLLEAPGPLVDIGAGAGLPGLPVALCRPERPVVLVESDRRKAAFINAAIAELGLPNARVVHCRAEGHPEAEGVPRGGYVVSRAFQDLARWAPLGRAYLAPGGTLLAMLGADRPGPEALRPLLDASGLSETARWEGNLPDGSSRCVLAMRYTTSGA